MNDGMLSQDEIDALLSISEDSDNKDLDIPVNKEMNVSDYLNPIEEDTIGEIGNISFGSSATTLSTLLNQKVSITTPAVSVVNKNSLYNEFLANDVKVKVTYVEGFHGENLFVIKARDAAIISDIMLGGDGIDPDENLNEIHLSAIQEAMNQMMGAAATSMSTIFNKRVNISPPMIESNDQNHETIEQIEEEVFVQVSFQLKVGNLVDSNIMQLIPFPFAHEMVEELLHGPEQEQEIEDDKEIIHTPPIEQSFDEDHSIEENIQAPESEEDEQSQLIGAHIDTENAVVQQASFSDFEQVNLKGREQRNLDLLLDIPLKVTVELGRTNRPIKDILELASGSIIELDKLAGEPVDIYVNQKLIAKGEVVVIDENFGVRVTDIISKSARLMKLN